MSDSNKNKGNSPKPSSGNKQSGNKSNQPKPSSVNESFGDQHQRGNLEKSFVHTDNPIGKPKK